MTYTWTLRYQQDGNRTYWIVDGMPEGHHHKFCSNNYCSFNGWDFQHQRHGWASSPSGMNARDARNYFLAELRELAASVHGDDAEWDKPDWPKFSVRRVHDLV